RQVGFLGSAPDGCGRSARVSGWCGGLASRGGQGAAYVGGSLAVAALATPTRSPRSARDRGPAVIPAPATPECRHFVLSRQGAGGPSSREPSQPARGRVSEEGEGVLICR